MLMFLAENVEQDAPQEVQQPEESVRRVPPQRTWPTPDILLWSPRPQQRTVLRNECDTESMRGRGAAIWIFWMCQKPVAKETLYNYKYQQKYKQLKLKWVKLILNVDFCVLYLPESFEIKLTLFRTGLDC